MQLDIHRSAHSGSKPCTTVYSSADRSLERVFKWIRLGVGRRALDKYFWAYKR